MFLALLALLLGIASANPERRRLVLGDAHSGNNVHVRLSFNTLSEATTNVFIDNVGIGYAYINIGTIEFNASATPKMTYTPDMFPQNHVFFNGDCAICQDAIMYMELGTCTVQLLPNDIVDIECPLIFNDGSEFANHRYHVPCSDGTCGELKTYSVTAQYANIPDASTTMHFTSDCDTDSDYHLLYGICVRDSCHRCQNGYYCSDTPGALGNCTQCADGYDTRNDTNHYVTQGASTCVECSNGQYQSGLDQCQECPLGSHTVDASGNTTLIAATNCVLCPIGTYRDEPGKRYSCKDCRDGFMTVIGTYGDYNYTTIGANLCRSCPYGKVQKGNTECQECRDGTETRKNMSGEMMFTPQGGTVCGSCWMGKYARVYTSGSLVGQRRCLWCGDGKETTNGTGNGQRPFDRGPYDVFTSFEATDCAECKAGSWLKTEWTEDNNHTMIQCAVCPEGHEIGFPDGATLGYPVSCTGCAIGKYSVDHVCTTCQDGYETQNATGHFVESLASQCVACQNGQFQSGTDACTVCTDGSDTRKNSIFVTSGATHCVACQSDFFQSGNDECSVCIDGFQTLDTHYEFASIEATQCQGCEPGKYQTGTDPCVQCPIGSDTRDANGTFTMFAATQCVPCIFGKETKTLTSECTFVDCSLDPEKCRDPTIGACGVNGAVNCDGECVNRIEFQSDMNHCPVMYASVPLYPRPDDGLPNAEIGKCGSSPSTATETCVQWRGNLENGFDLHQVEMLADQDSTFCAELKALDDENDLSAAAPTCKPYFSVVAPIYVYPHVWNGTHNNLASEWQIFIDTAKAYPRVHFDVIINPNNGADSLAAPNLSWQALLTELNALSNVKLFGYVPTAYGNSDVSAQISSQISGYSSNWNIHDIFFDEVNGAILSGEVYLPRLQVYDGYSYEVSGKTICNMGSPSDAQGTAYDHWWFVPGNEICSMSILLEHEMAQLTNYTGITEQITGTDDLGQSTFARDLFGAILHTANAADMNAILDDVFEKRFGSIYLTSGTGVNPYVTLLGSAEWANFVQSIDEWSITAMNSRIPS